MNKDIFLTTFVDSVIRNNRFFTDGDVLIDGAGHSGRVTRNAGIGLYILVNHRTCTNDRIGSDCYVGHNDGVNTDEGVFADIDLAILVVDVPVFRLSVENPYGTVMGDKPDPGGDNGIVPDGDQIGFAAEVIGSGQNNCIFADFQALLLKCSQLIALVYFFK